MARASALGALGGRDHAQERAGLAAHHRAQAADVHARSPEPEDRERVENDILACDGPAHGLWQCIVRAAAARRSDHGLSRTGWPGRTHEVARIRNELPAWRPALLQPYPPKGKSKVKELTHGKEGVRGGACACDVGERHRSHIPPCSVARLRCGDGATACSLARPPPERPGVGRATWVALDVHPPFDRLRVSGP